MKPDPSPARLQVMWNRLLAVVEEQGQSPDPGGLFARSCANAATSLPGYLTFGGRMLAQAVTGTPGHINTMAEAVLRPCVSPL